MRRSSDDRRRRFCAQPTSAPTIALVDGWCFILRARLPTRRRGGLPRPPGLGLRITLVRPHRHRHQPLSHGASRRDSSPFRGAKGWAKVCGVGATVYHDADTFVPHPPVRGGVLDAPRLRDCRASLDASVRLDQLYPRHPRRARLASTAQRIISRGHGPRTIFYVRTHVIHHPTPGGRGSPPLRWVERHPHLTHVASTPQSRREAP